ncbi:Sodium-dependent neutral amino acid transporter B(0)AT1 [Orchesella cincta]|uniref:Sodium-dependent neutral amino acid transporter B(0)AT1 n=1 Tax=Orchesella cincta TaxID=48709 RepID=A0A1D2MR79_ORCCI|nr:Sodium-dependent neutral amino acid transporter B(0)AT1 [Orchesella cincta]
MGATCFVEAVTKFSADTFPSSKTRKKIYRAKFDSGVHKDFQQCYLLYRQLRILTETGGKGIQTFLQTLIAMGVPVGSFTIFSMVALYDHMNIVVWIGNMLMVPGIIILCFTLVGLAATPNVNSKKYFQYWRTHLHTKYDRKRLASCMELAFNLGAIFVLSIRMANVLKYREITASAIKIIQVEVTSSAGPIPPLHRLANETDSVELEERSGYDEGGEGDTTLGEDEGATTATLRDDSEVDKGGAHVREKWGSKFSYILTLIGFAVGFGNIWRFPYVFSDNGGGFPHPILFRPRLHRSPDLLSGALHRTALRKRVINAWHEVSPTFGGIGISCGWLCAVISLYYNVLVAYCFIYWMDSFKSPLPWEDCSSAPPPLPHPSEIPSYLQECEKIGGHSAMYYMNRGVFQISSSITIPGNYSLRLMGCILLTWFIIWLVLFKGVKMLGKVVWFTSLFPYVCILTFLIVVSMQEGAFFGAWRLVQPDWAHLLEPIAWLKGGSQIFFSLGLAQGCLVVFASFNPERNNCHKDAVSISLINSATSMFMACVTFPFIGSLGYRKYKECIDGIHDISTPALTPDFDLHSNSWTLDNAYDIYWMRYSQENFVDFFPSPSEPVQLRYGIGNPAAKDLFTIVDNVTVLFTPKNCSIHAEAMKSGSGTGLVFIAYGEAVLPPSIP